MFATARSKSRPAHCCLILDKFPCGLRGLRKGDRSGIARSRTQAHLEAKWKAHPMVMGKFGTLRRRRMSTNLKELGRSNQRPHLMRSAHERKSIKILIATLWPDHLPRLVPGRLIRRCISLTLGINITTTSMLA